MKLYISGASGFLGRHVRDVFSRGPHELLTGKIDLLDPIETSLFISRHKPDMVIHLAGRVGGIEENINRPAEFIYDNLVIGINLIAACAENKVRRFVNVASSCCYPDTNSQEPLTTRDLWAGLPNWTHAPYGLSKRMMIKVCDAFQRQYGMECVSIILANLYGPGDKWADKGSHVIPAFFRMFTDAKERRLDNVSISGNPEATREFLFVKDAAKAIAHFAHTYHSTEPLNYGAQQTTTIGQLAKEIASLVGYTGSITYNQLKPSGNQFRRMNSEKAHKDLKPATSLSEGLLEALNDFKASKELSLVLPI